MAVINYAKREISAKIVFYGPSLCGKTTNIQQIFNSITPDQKGKLVSLATEADRTLFFDFLPIEIANIRGFKTRLHFYTVPGQVYYNSTRRAVLTGVDGLVFVADSQRDKMEENVESLANLEDNLNYYGKSMKTLPMVIQYNKRDLTEAMSVAEMQQILNPDGLYPTFEAVATTGDGVLPSLTKITKLVLEYIESGTSGKQQRPATVAPQTMAAAPESEPTPAPRPAPPEMPRASEPAMEPMPSAPLSGEPEVVELLDEAEPAPVPEPEVSVAPEPVSATPPPGLMTSGRDEFAFDEQPAMEESFAGGRIQIVGTGDATIIAANAINLPLRLKIGGDDRTYSMDVAIKLDSIIPEE